MHTSAGKDVSRKSGTPGNPGTPRADQILVLSLLPDPLWPPTTEQNFTSLSVIFADVKQTLSSRNFSNAKSVQKINTHHDDTSWSQACANWGAVASLQDSTPNMYKSPVLCALADDFLHGHTALSMCPRLSPIGEQPGRPSFSVPSWLVNPSSKVKDPLPLFSPFPWSPSSLEKGPPVWLAFWVCGNES